MLKIEQIIRIWWNLAEYLLDPETRKGAKFAKFANRIATSVQKSFREFRIFSLVILHFIIIYISRYILSIGERNINYILGTLFVTLIFVNLVK